MITLLILLADMWYYMFTGNNFLYLGQDDTMVATYMFFGIILAVIEIAALMSIADSVAEKHAIEHQRKLNELNTKNMWGK